MNLIEIGPVVIEIRGAENGKLAVPVNNTLVSHMAFLAADTRPCVLIHSPYMIIIPCDHQVYRELVFGGILH